MPRRQRHGRASPSGERPGSTPTRGSGTRRRLRGQLVADQSSNAPDVVYQPRDEKAAELAIPLPASYVELRKTAGEARRTTGVPVGA